MCWPTNIWRPSASAWQLTQAIMSSDLCWLTWPGVRSLCRGLRWTWAELKRGIQHVCFRFTQPLSTCVVPASPAGSRWPLCGCACWLGTLQCASWMWAVVAGTLSTLWPPASLPANSLGWTSVLSPGGHGSSSFRGCPPSCSVFSQWAQIVKSEQSGMRWHALEPLWSSATSLTLSHPSHLLPFLALHHQHLNISGRQLLFWNRSKVGGVAWSSQNFNTHGLRVWMHIFFLSNATFRQMMAELG